jgi:hypothetical protein
MSERPVRDQHGNPLPTGEEVPDTVGAEQVDEALAWLPGWQRRGSTLVRPVPVSRESREILARAVRSVASDDTRLSVEPSDEGLTIMLAAGPGEMKVLDLETAARIDTVIDGSDIDRERQ